MSPEPLKARLYVSPAIYWLIALGPLLCTGWGVVTFLVAAAIVWPIGILVLVIDTTMTVRKNERARERYLASHEYAVDREEKRQRTEAKRIEEVKRKFGHSLRS